jgi:hypothetical protein
LFTSGHLLVGEDAIMAFHDALFQLGMDLDRDSSTAQTEENHALGAAHRGGEERTAFSASIERKARAAGRKLWLVS